MFPSASLGGTNVGSSVAFFTGVLSAKPESSSVGAWVTGLGAEKKGLTFFFASTATLPWSSTKPSPRTLSWKYVSCWMRGFGTTGSLVLIPVRWTGV